MFFSWVALAHSAEQKEYVSPDGKYRAIVISLSGGGESKVVIKTIKGKTLRSENYGSKDGEHGGVVEKAAWTPDSSFFVYSISSSGGHQPWNSPIDYISVRDSKVRHLDDYIGTVTEPEFELKAPDTIKAVGSKGSPEEAARFEVSLSKLVMHEKKK